MKLHDLLIENNVLNRHIGLQHEFHNLLKHINSSAARNNFIEQFDAVNEKFKKAEALDREELMLVALEDMKKVITQVNHAKKSSNET